MTDLAIDRYSLGESLDSGWDWPQRFLAPMLLSEASFCRFPFKTTRPDISASWATEDAYHFEAQTPVQPVVRVTQATADRPWFRPLIVSLAELLALGPNWNGYNEAPVDPENAVKILTVLDASGFEGPSPAVVPLHDGSVQAEWHWGDRHLEVEFIRGRVPTAWWYDGDTDEEWSLETGADLRRLRECLANVAPS